MNLGGFNAQEMLYVLGVTVGPSRHSLDSLVES